MSKTYSLISDSTKILLAVFQDVFDSTAGKDFSLSREGMKKYARDMAMSEPKFMQAVYQLKRRGLVDKNEQGFLISPVGCKVLKRIMVEQEDWREEKWDQEWKIIIFDIPETKRRQRTSFRKFLRRKGFCRLQDSVFISPYINIDSLNFIRHDLEIEQYVNFFIAKSGNIDDDQKLKDHFGLN